jgi:acetyl esterase/lipase
METILLWPEGQTPGALGRSAPDIPPITLYKPESAPNGASVIVCPGGGYETLAAHEGEPVALWLNSLGITAFVLRYRLAPGYRHPTPLDDVQRALHTVRSRSGEWDLDPQRIGVLGFSAGGHLASTAATYFDAGIPDSTDPIEQAGSRPDIAILIYPVITLDGRSVNLGSRRNLIGENAAPDLIELLSNQKHVTPETPPCFLVHSVDDRVVTVENSLEFALALSANDVPYAMQVYEHGGHGYGLGGTVLPGLVNAPPGCGHAGSWVPHSSKRYAGLGGDLLTSPILQNG